MTPAETIQTHADEARELLRQVEPHLMAIRGQATAAIFTGDVVPRETTHTVTQEPGLLLPVPSPQAFVARWKAKRDGPDGLAVRLQKAPYNLTRPEYAAWAAAINDVAYQWAIGAGEQYAQLAAQTLAAVEAEKWRDIPPGIVFRCAIVQAKLVAAQQ